MKTYYPTIVRIDCINCIDCIVYIVCIAFIVCIPRISKAQVRDDFSDGDFTENPAWTGDTSRFEINGAGQLHLNSTGSDTSVMFTRNGRLMNTEWNFWMKLSLNTSANNHARVYLTADTDNISTIVKGYFLQVGGSDDSIFIMKQTGMTEQTVYRFNSYKTLHSTNTIRFKITRDGSGNWEALIDTTGGYNYISDGTFYEDSFTETQWFGLMCRYTLSNSTKFYFDDFYVGPVMYDTLPPEIVETQAMDARVLHISFSEPMQIQSAEDVKNYNLASNGMMPDSVSRELLHPEHVLIFLHDTMADGTTDSIQIRNLADLSGNLMRDTIVQISCYQPKAFDILIHEIMADPDPPAGLPNGEFVELYNRTAFSINLEGWTFKYGSYSKAFPAITIPARGYILIVKETAYLSFGKCAVLFTSSSSLSNEGTTLTLRGPRGQVIHTVTYSPDWYRGIFKEEGGWSLEMSDPLNPCGCMDNWEPSRDPSGGTPGRANSTGKENPDEVAPFVMRAFITDSLRLKVTFSEAMDSLTLLSPGKWIITPSETPPAGIIPVSPEFSSIELVFREAFINGVTYSLRISGNMSDCAGNDADTSRLIRFAIPDTVNTCDVVINEILSNPASGGSRFVELYNRSEKIIDLQTLVLSNRDTVAGFPADAMPLTTGGYLLFPDEYVAFTSSPADIIDKYHPVFPENIAGMTGFPVFGDDTGTVVLARKDNMVIIDKMQYNPGMHYPLLVTSEGVSLERTNPGLPSDDLNNWHSAAETAWFATPGYQNSHWVVSDETSQEVVVQPDIFSPDNDGRDDLLIVTIRVNEPDFAVNMAVYDSRGRLTRQLANHVLIGSKGVFMWDGMTVLRTKAPMGIYVLLVELVHPVGTVRKIKRAVFVGGKL
jgi:hypothetical protein